MTLNPQSEPQQLGPVVAELASRFRRTSPSAGGRSTQTPKSRSDRPWPPGVARATWEQADAKIVVQSLQAISDGAWPLVIAGDVGAGKSCLAALLLSLVPDRSARMLDCSTLLGHVMEARTSPSGATSMPLLDGGSVDRTESQILRWIDQMSLLVLDDVGVRALTEPQSEALLRIVNLRHGKPLIVTTNCTALQLPDMVGHRINSRLREGAGFRIESPDRRLVR